MGGASQTGEWDETPTAHSYNKKNPTPKLCQDVKKELAVLLPHFCQSAESIGTNLF